MTKNKSPNGVMRGHDKENIIVIQNSNSILAYCSPKRNSYLMAFRIAGVSASDLDQQACEMATKKSFNVDKTWDRSESAVELSLTFG